MIKTSSHDEDIFDDGTDDSFSYIADDGSAGYKIRVKRCGFKGCRNIVRRHFGFCCKHQNENDRLIYGRMRQT